MRKLSLIAFAAAVGLASGATAQTPGQPGQAYGLTAIQHADYSGAEARLTAQRSAEPHEPSVLLNLAYVYAKTGRASQAAALYAEVMASENVLMTTAAGQPAWSHDIAQKAVARTRIVMASR